MKKWNEEQYDYEIGFQLLFTISAKLEKDSVTMEALLRISCLLFFYEDHAVLPW
ncbi:MAG: hypothetical protein ACI97P_002903 [Arcticibacterium sp.]|jgi:hypothetical protein